MNGYEAINAASMVVFSGKSIESVLYKELIAYVEDPLIEVYVKKSGFVGKLLKAPEQNTCYLILVHEPTQDAAVLHEAMFKFGKPVEDFFSFEKQHLPSKKEGTSEFHFMSVLMVVPKPVSKLDLIGAYQAYKRQRITGGLELKKFFQAFSDYSIKVKEVSRDLYYKECAANVLSVTHFEEMSFEVCAPAKSKNKDYNLAHWVEKALKKLRAKHTIADLDAFSKKAFWYNDHDYGAAVFVNKHGVECLFIQDQNCGFIVEYESFENYRVYCADFTLSDEGLGGFKTATSFKELLRVAESIDKDVKNTQLFPRVENNKQQESALDFHAQYSTLVVKDSTLQFIHPIGVYCLWMDLYGMFL